MGQVETVSLSRVMKILERSVKLGEDVDPFAWTHVAPPSSRKTASLSPKKQARTRKRSKSKTPVEGEENAQDSTVVEKQEPTAIDFEKVAMQVEHARDAVLAAECCMTLLSSDRLPKEVCMLRFFLFFDAYLPSSYTPRSS